MRVMEDAARFVLDDATLCGELKSMRHDLRAAADSLAPADGWLEANRDASGDVGTSIGTESEFARGGLLDVVIAAAKRLTESLRVIEELAKTINIDAAQQIESLRYRTYAIDAALQRRLGTGRARQWKLCVLLTQSLCRRPWRDVLHGAIEGGADCLQIREKQMDGGELVRLVREAIEIARPRGVSVIVNDRADVALAAGADGVHVGATDLSIRDVRRIAGRGLIIGASTHDLNEARTAVEAGADYCGVGAMFSTALKPQRVPAGIAYLQAFIDRYPNVPHLAIGGVTPQRVPELVAAGARGVAVSSAVCEAEDPAAACAAIVQAITQANQGASAVR